MFITEPSPKRRNQKGHQKCDAENVSAPFCRKSVRIAAERLNIEGKKRQNHCGACGHEKIRKPHDHKVFLINRDANHLLKKFEFPFIINEMWKLYGIAAPGNDEN